MIRTLFIATMLFASTSAEAQTRNCADYSTVVQRLLSGYGESPRTVGMGANNNTVVQFANEETGSWTIVVVDANLVACLVAAGEAWTLLEPVNTDSAL